MKLVVNQTLVEYAISGKGRPLLFLHGWGSDNKTFHSLITSLANRYTCISLDLPGFGQSEAPGFAWGLDDYTAFLHDFLHKLNINEELEAVVGHSNGGAIAIHGLAAGAFRAKKLVLLGSAGIRNKVPKRKLALKVIAKTGKVITRPLPKHVRSKLRGKLYSSIGSDMLLIPHLQETFQKTVGQDVLADAVRVSAQTLLIYGALDKETPVADGEKIAKTIPNARLEVVPAAGHFVHQEAQDIVTKLVTEFLK